MGLDQWLEKKHYVKNWDFMKEKEKTKITVLKGGKKHPEINTDKISEITEEVATWRKANAIHKWFVENVQEGSDDCKEYEVSREQLAELLKLVNEVLEKSELIEGKITNGYTYKNGKEEPILEDGKLIKNPEIAQKLLPTTDGFFFGMTNYDQWYIQTLEDTKNVLTEALKSENGVFYYRSSW